MAAPNREVVPPQGCFSLLLALLLFAGTASAGVNQWSPSGPPAKVSSLTIDGSGTLYALTLDGIYNSRDHGDTWNLVNAGLTSEKVHALAGDPRYGGAFAVGCGAFESDDFGVDWFPIGRGLPADCSVTTLDLDPDRTGTLFASGASGLYRSDYGSDWRKIDLGLFRGPVSLVVIGAWEHPDSFTPILFAAPEAGGFFISDDGGDSWSSANGPAPGIRIRALAFDQGNIGPILAGTDQGLYQTVDGGDTWTNADSSLTGMNVQSLGAAKGVIYLATGTGIFRRYYPPSNSFSAGLSAGMEFSKVVVDPSGRHVCAVPANGDGTFVYHYAIPQIHFQQTHATIAVGQPASLPLSIDPEQPPGLPVTVASSDPNLVYDAADIRFPDTLTPFQTFGSIHVLGSQPSSASVTITAAVGADTPGCNSTTMTVDVVNPRPQIDAVFPLFLPAGGSGGTLQVLQPYGVWMIPGAVVYWNGSPRPTRFIDVTVCTLNCRPWLAVDISAQDVVIPGTAAITIVNPPPGGGESPTFLFPIGAENVRPPVTRLPGSPTPRRDPSVLPPRL